jgi:hypothetical protein
VPRLGAGCLPPAWKRLGLLGEAAGERRITAVTMFVEARFEVHYLNLVIIFFQSDEHSDMESDFGGGYF